MTDSRVFFRMPLVQHVFENESQVLSYRAVDNNWYYAGICPFVMTGFNPFLKRIMVAEYSTLSKWIRDSELSVRELNYKDRLVREILFTVHDYIHIWAWEQIEQIQPRLSITSQIFETQSTEEYVFAFLLTEAAATVGLDYWYLSTIDLNEILDIGTTVENLTISFHEKHLSEYRKFNEDFEVQRPEFFADLAKFYCSGTFKGFTAQDICRSPLMTRWLVHELKYGNVQRIGARRWFEYLGGSDGDGSPNRDRSVAIDQQWQEELVSELGARLWTFVKEGQVKTIETNVKTTWRTAPNSKMNFCYRNAKTCHPSVWTGNCGNSLSARSKKYLCYQLISGVIYDPQNGYDITNLTKNLNSLDVEILQRTLDKFEEIPPIDEPRDLIFAN